MAIEHTRLAKVGTIFALVAVYLCLTAYLTPIEAKGIVKSDKSITGVRPDISGSGSRFIGSDFRSRSFPNKFTNGSSFPSTDSNRTFRPTFITQSETRVPSTRLDVPTRLGTSSQSPRTFFGATETKEAYRKVYSDMCKIWENRSEKRNTLPEKPQRSPGYNHYGSDNRRHWGFPYYTPYSTVTFHFDGYCHEYYPGWSYPSVYCYYRTAIPCCCRSTQIVVIPTIHSRGLFAQFSTVLDLSDNEYTRDRCTQELRRTIMDIRRAWETGNPIWVQYHLRPGSRLAIYFKGTYAYSIGTTEFWKMTCDLMESVTTRSFILDRVSKESPNRVTVFGKHEYIDKDKHQELVYVAYTLECVNDRWYITKVGTSPYRIYHM